ncbi:MAG: domain S-box protein [Solirubrobacterales bacterium]|jgi:GAF domain-containing protein|nr:domain S-box protein [Solirubrobacterales bacterium]
MREERAVLEALAVARGEIARSALGFEEVMQLMCDTALGLLGADAVAVDFVVGDELITHAITGDGSAHVGLVLSLSASLAGLCARTGHVINCGDSLHDPRTDFGYLSRTGHASVLCVPILEYGLPIGVFKAGSQRNDAFGDREATVLRLLAEVIVAHLA